MVSSIHCNGSEVDFTNFIVYNVGKLVECPRKIGKHSLIACRGLQSLVERPRKLSLVKSREDRAESVGCRSEDI